MNSFEVSKNKCVSVQNTVKYDASKELSVFCSFMTYLKRWTNISVNSYVTKLKTKT